MSLQEENRKAEEEETLDRMLGFLGSINPDAGFEKRMLKRLGHRTLRRSRRSKRLPLWVVGFATALPLALVVIALLHTRHVTTDVGLDRTTAEAPALSTRDPGRSAFRAAGSAEVPERKAGSRQLKSQLASETPTNEPDFATAFPPAPAPLTEQERLLLRIAHTGDPQEFVALNPEARAMLKGQRDAETVEFFQDQVLPDHTDQTITNDEGDAR